MSAPAGSLSRLAYTPAEAAEALGLCRATIYNLIARGDLRAVKFGRATRIMAAEINAAAERLVVAR